MTTPRNDITWPICCYCDNSLSCAHCGREQPDSAATQLAALSARVKELEGLLANGEDLRSKVKVVAEQWQARALRAEQEFDALSARVKELEQTNANLSRDKNTLLVDGARLEERARRAEQERDELQLRHDKLTTLVGGIVIELGCAADSEAVFKAIAKLKQERDEAYERAALIVLDICNTQADGWQRNPGADRSGEIAASNCGVYAATAIRRLAPGPEKEKK